MITGATQPRDGEEWTGQEAQGSALSEAFQFEAVAEEEPAARSTGKKILAALLILLALGWLGVAGYAVRLARPGGDLAAWATWIGTISAPLILLALIWLLFGRTMRRETERFTTAVAAMRRESQALESVLAIVAHRLQENRSGLTEEAARLMALGDEASDRLGRVTHYLARETAELDRKSQALDAAAATARIDIGVLMADLPRAEAHARSAAEAMKAAGLNAHEQAAALEGQLAALTARSRETDETVGSAAQRLGAHIARIESSTGAASERMDQAAAQMNAAVDGAMARAADSVEQARATLETQGRTMLAMIEQSRAAFDHAGAESSRGVAERLEQARSGLEGLAQRMLATIEHGRATFEQANREAETRTSERLASARAGMEEQGRAMLALLDESRAAFEQAGAEASARIAERLDVVGRKLEWVAGQLAAHETASQALVAGLSSRLSEVAEQLAALGRSGDEENERLGQSIATLRSVAAELQREVADGGAASAELIARTQELSGAVAGVTVQLREELPRALADVEAQAARTGSAAQAAVPSVEALKAAAAEGAESLAASEASVVRQREALEALLERVRSGAAEAEEQLRALGGGIGEADASATRLVQDTGPQLIEALIRVRETANQAASHAREAIIQVIPDSVAALTEATREAIAEAAGEPVSDQLAEIAGAAQRAMVVARHASERLTRQLLVMSETAQAVEDRIAEDRAQREEKAAENLTRRVSLLIEALNSTAIDVNKILSNEVADTAWTSYLKGDRGVFTRRAVRLLDSGEAREIQRHYADEPDFREQVNRYVHDFESMLRRVLADREGTTLGVTLLSSDMGKLYVALAQAIERIRS